MAHPARLLATSCALLLHLMHLQLLQLPQLAGAGFACLSSPCVYGICMDDLNSTFTCYCIDGYTGALCQTNWDECWSSPCLNGATCVDGVAAFNCTCPDGYVGELCELDVNECLSNPCLNNGTCLDGPNGYACMCQPGYSGDRCEMDVAVCNATAEARCHNGGACQEGPGMDFSCVCQPGWTGALCEEPVNECESSPCQHGGVCVDLHAGYACACLFGYTGRHCEQELEPCARNPCLNGALCLLEAGVDVCYCVPDYHGDRCQLQYDECRRGPGCQNGGTCIDGVDEFSCTCPAGLSGGQCECVVQAGGQLNCTAAPRWTTSRPRPRPTLATSTPMSPTRPRPKPGPRPTTSTIRTPVTISTIPVTRTTSRSSSTTMTEREPSINVTLGTRTSPASVTWTTTRGPLGSTSSFPFPSTEDEYPTFTTFTATPAGPAPWTTTSAWTTMPFGQDTSPWTTGLSTAIDISIRTSSTSPAKLPVTSTATTLEASPGSSPGTLLESSPVTSPATSSRPFPGTSLETTTAVAEVAGSTLSGVTDGDVMSTSSQFPEDSSTASKTPAAPSPPTAASATSASPSDLPGPEVPAVSATRDPKAFAVPTTTTTTTTSAMTPHAQLTPGGEVGTAASEATSGTQTSVGGDLPTSEAIPVTATLALTTIGHVGPTTPSPSSHTAPPTTPDTRNVTKAVTVTSTGTVVGITAGTATDFLWTTQPPGTVPGTSSPITSPSPDTSTSTLPSTSSTQLPRSSSVFPASTTSGLSSSAPSSTSPGEVEDAEVTSIAPEANVTDCSEAPCQNGATCEDTPDGIKCLCAFGWTGPRCDEEVRVTAAAFTGHSFLVHRLSGTTGGAGGGSGGGLLGHRVAVRARTLAPSGLLLHAALAPELYMTLFLEDGLLRFQFSCGVQTMVFSEVQHRVNNGFDLHIAASLEVLPLRGAMRPCAAALHVNHSLAMSGEQQSVAHAEGAEPDGTLDHDVLLYLGGLPAEGNALHPDNADHPGALVGGLVGCMLGLEVDGSPRRIHEDAIAGAEVAECAALACLSAPCHAGGTCVQEGQRWHCLCPSGYVGSTCERSVCQNNPCKFGGTCVPFPASGFLCLCPLGKHGLFCESDLEIAQPSFSPSVGGLSSFAAYSLPVAVEDALEVRFRFVPSTEDQVGLMLFLGQDGAHDSSSDHLAVSFIKGYVVLTWNLGSGPRRIFTPRPLEPRVGRPHSVRVGRMGTTAWLLADSMANVTGTSPGPLRQLNTVPLLYLGGHDATNFSGLPHDLPLHSGFAGCLLDVEVVAGAGPGRVAVTLERARAVAGRAVGQCGTTLCHARACQHRAACLHHAASFSCLCPDGWFGPVCGQRFNPCDSTRHNCSEGSTCVPLRDGFECDCPLGRAGRYCEKVEAVTDVLLSGRRSFLALGPVDLQRAQSCVAVEVRPLSDNGLLLFAGHVSGGGGGPGAPGAARGSASLALVLRGGLLEARLAVGGGVGVAARRGHVVTLRSRRVLARDDWHRVRVCRYGRRLFLWVDGSAHSAALRPAHRLPPADAPLFLGGVPDLSGLPAALSGPSALAVPLRGCVRGLSVNWRHVPLDAAHILDARNVEDCDGTACGGDLCHYGGSCWIGDEGAAYCTCARGYSGRYCERQLACAEPGRGRGRRQRRGLDGDLERELQCRNKGRCVNARCHCPAGWGGPFCEEEVPLGTPHFGGEGFLVLGSDRPHSIDMPARQRAGGAASDVEQFAERMSVRGGRDVSFLYLNYSTTQENGMILWSAEDDELIGVGVEAGRLKVVWGWRGAGVFVAVVPGTTVSDGAWHDVALSFGPNVTLWTDAAPGALQRPAALPRPVASGGVFYVGGFPGNKSVTLETRGIFNARFNGCLQQLSWNQDSSVTDFTGYPGENVGSCELFEP